jgi:hypothetical protein
MSSGCLWSRVKINDTDAPAKARTIRPGTTTASELVKTMGAPPNSIIPLKNNRTIFIYNSSDSKQKGFNIIILGISKTNTRTSSTYFLINENAIVEKVSTAKPGNVEWEWWAFDEK